MLSTRMQGAAFTPNHLPSLQLWLDAADMATITESSGAVSQWDDKSGNDNHAMQSLGSAQPQLISNALNRHSGVRFDGLDDVLETGCAPDTGGYSFFVVMRLNAAISAGASFPRIFRTVNDAQALFLRRSTGNFEIKSQASGANDPRPTFGYESVYSEGIPALIAVDTKLDSLQAWADAAQQFDINRSAVASVLLSDVTSEVGSLYAGDIFEITLFDRVLTLEEKTQLTLYLAAKWGISL